MAFTPESLKQQIEEAEAAITAGEAAKRALPHLQQALVALEAETDDTSAVGPSQAPKQKKKKVKKDPATGDFKPKYDKSAGELAEDILREADRALTQRQILDKLAEDGKTFSGAALNLALNKRDTIKRVSAPRDSASKYAYKLAE